MRARQSSRKSSPLGPTMALKQSKTCDCDDDGIDDVDDDDDDVLWRVVQCPDSQM